MYYTQQGLNALPRAEARSFGGLVPAALAVGCLSLAFVAPATFGVIAAVPVIVFTIAIVPAYPLLVALVATIPFQHFLDFYGPGSGTLLFGAAIRDVLTGILVVQFFLVVLPKRAAPRLLTHEKLAIAFVAVLAVLLPFSPSIAGALITFRNLAVYICLMLVTPAAVKSVRQRNRLLIVVVAAGFVSALIGVIETITLRQLFEWIGYDITALMGSERPDVYLGLPRATGGSGNPLEFGFYMGVIMAICMSVMASKHRARMVCSVIFVVCMAALTFTLARSAYVSFAAAFMILAWVYRRKTILIPVLVVIPIIAIITVSGYSELLSARVTLNDEAGVTTADQRADLWQKVLKKMVTSPLGEGLGTQGGATERSGVSTDLVVTDNFYGNISMQAGVVPLGLFVALLGSIALYAKRLFTVRVDNVDKALCAASIAIVAMILVDSVASSAFESRIISITVWVLFGLLTYTGGSKYVGDRVVEANS